MLHVPRLGPDSFLMDKDVIVLGGSTGNCNSGKSYHPCNTDPPMHTRARGSMPEIKLATTEVYYDVVDGLIDVTR